MDSNDSERGEGSSGHVVDRHLSHVIVGCFYEVYNELGQGLLESLYARALEIAMRERGLCVDREYPLAVTFRGQQIGFFRVDMLVERRVIVELKSSERIPESAHRQLRSYLNCLGLKLGILLHFGSRPRFYRELGVRKANPNSF
jgi:GxxExxY protein